MPDHTQSGVQTALLNVSDAFESFHAATSLLGPQAPSSLKSTCALSIESCVALSTCPVHGEALLAVLLVAGHQFPPLYCTDVILTIPAGVIVPLNVTEQFETIDFLLSVVSPVAENGSPFGFIDWPSTRETVTAKAGAAETAVNTAAATSDAI
ncbi:hypothetical protein [Streptomyces sp. NPDC005476]|uniref:hypothetical protein n=1 Tax=Streptomyces sp. NPDC005476 TaxID=3156882 RepID=UPI0034555011